MNATCPICHTPLSCVGTCPDRDEEDHWEPRYIEDMTWRERRLLADLEEGGVPCFTKC